jgi:peptidoglycan LD-endopeptidase CwlK
MINSRDINELHPTVKRGAMQLQSKMKELGYDLLVTSTYRDLESQSALYAQGRTLPGKIVTNAKAGQSIHNYRLAFDVCKNKKGQEFSDNRFFELCGKVWTEMGGEWGGSWVGFKDNPHMQFTNGLKDSEIFLGKNIGDVKMKWETITEKPKEGEIYLITKLELIKDGKNITTNNIFFSGKNYVELRGYEEAGGSLVNYDDKNKRITITSKK